MPDFFCSTVRCSPIVTLGATAKTTFRTLHFTGNEVNYSPSLDLYFSLVG